MADNITPSPDNQERANAPSQGVGNEDVGRIGSSSGETASQSQDFSGNNRDQLLQNVSKLQTELEARNRDYKAAKQHALDQVSQINQYRQQQDQLSLQLKFAQDQIAKSTRQTANTVQPHQAQAQNPNLNPVYGSMGLSDQEVEAMHNSVLEGNVGATKQILSKFKSSVIEELRNQQTIENTRAIKSQAAQITIQNIAGENIRANPAFATKVLEKYTELSSDPVYSAYAMDAPTIKAGNYDLNAEILKEAVWRAKMETMYTQNQAQNHIQRTHDNFVEPGSFGTQGLPDRAENTKINPDNIDHIKKLFTHDELEYFQRRRMSDKEIINYFKWLPDAVKNARLDRRSPVTSGELGLKIVK